MICIYEANNTIEANILKGRLAQEGISAFIAGEYLQGGMGELPALGLIRVMVDEIYENRARTLIAAWQKEESE